MRRTAFLSGLAPIIAIAASPPAHALAAEPADAEQTQVLMPIAPGSQYHFGIAGKLTYLRLRGFWNDAIGYPPPSSDPRSSRLVVPDDETVHMLIEAKGHNVLVNFTAPDGVNYVELYTHTRAVEEEYPLAHALGRFDRDVRPELAIPPGAFMVERREFYFKGSGRS